MATSKGSTAKSSIVSNAGSKGLAPGYALKKNQVGGSNYANFQQESANAGFTGSAGTKTAIKAPTEVKKPTSTSYTAGNNKVYDIAKTDKGYSFASKSAEGGIKNFDTFDLAKAEIDKYNAGAPVDKNVNGMFWGKLAGENYGNDQDAYKNRNLKAIEQIGSGNTGERLKKQHGFTDASPEDQKKTLDDINRLMSENVAETAYTKEQITIAEKGKEDIDFAKQQQQKQLQIDNLQAANAGINRSETIEKSQQQLDALKQSVAYMGSMGAPGISSTHLDAISKQMDSAQTTYDRIVQMKNNEATMASLSAEYNAEAYEKNISDLQYQLDQQVSMATQNAINTLTANGEKIDTMEELSVVRRSIFEELDKSIANIAISNQAQRKLIIDRYNEVIKTSEETVKAKATIDEALSNSTGFIVDGLGENKLDANGQKIPYISDAMKPIYDSKDNVLIQFTRGPNGEIIASTSKAFGGGGGVGSGGGGVGGYSSGGTAAAPTFSSSYNPDMIAAYTAYIEKGQAPTQSQINALGGLSNFASDAYKAYISNENKKLSAGGFQLTDPSLYATLDATERKTLNNDMRTLRGVTQKIDAINKKISENGLPLGGQGLVGYGRELKQQVKDLQLILKEEGIYNLGVLNGPDLTIIEGALPNIDTARWAEGPEQYMKYMNNMKQIFVNNVNANIAGQGLKFNNSGNITTMKKKGATTVDTNTTTEARADIFN